MSILPKLHFFRNTLKFKTKKKKFLNNIVPQIAYLNSPPACKAHQAGLDEVTVVHLAVQDQEDPLVSAISI